MSGLNELEQGGHEEVAFHRDPQTGITMIVAIHSTALGPALGGTRMMAYPSLDLALTDVLRLSQGMSYKNSLAGLNLGGGKAVIVADRKLEVGRRELFRSFGKFVESFGGRYITAEDLGTSVEDMNAVLESTAHVTGRDQSRGGGGDPSPYTALGVLAGMRACAEHVYGSRSLKGLRIAIQGVGHVGSELCKLLVDEGAKLLVADVRPEALEHAVKAFGAEAVELDKVLSVDCDILAPCAVGGIINPETVGAFRAKIIAGGANNQISAGQISAGQISAGQIASKQDAVEQQLFERGIVYAPDFAINSGGVILCYDELEPGGFTKSRVEERAGNVYSTICRILNESKQSSEPPGRIAVRLAKERIARGRSLSS